MEYEPYGACVVSSLGVELSYSIPINWRSMPRSSSGSAFNSCEASFPI